MVQPGGEMTEPDATTAIAAVQNAYATAIDRRDWVARRRCFAADARIKYGRPARSGDLEVFGRYEDELVVADDRWVIRRREFHPVWRRRTENKLEMVSRG
jgi:hypothetical protein